MRIYLIKNTMNDELEKMIIKNMGKGPQTVNYAIETIYGMVKSGILDLSPIYQRNFILKNNNASQYIESILMGCVIPEVQLYNNSESGVLEVIDGQQRLTSIINFMDNKFKLSQLKELPYLNGFFFNELPFKIQNLIRNYGINSRVMKFTDDPYYQYKVFERLNLGSKKLNTQELRNCIYRGYLISELKNIHTVSVVKQLMPMDNTRYKVTEYSLKLLSLNEFFRGRMNWGSNTECIDKFLNKNYLKPDNEIKEKLDNLYANLKVIKQVFGTKAFFIENKFSPTIMDITYLISISINKHDLINNSNIIRDILEEFIKGKTLVLKKTLFKKELEDVVGDILLEFNKKKTSSVDVQRFFSKEDRLSLWNNSLKICAICNQKILDFDDCEVDHIIPYSLGGQTSIENAQITHKICNRIKSNNVKEVN